MSSTLRLYEENYSIIHHPDGTYATSLVEALKRIPATARTVMDVGCSRGDFGRLIKHIDPNRRVIGLEFLAQAAELARQHLDQVIEADIQEELHLPLEEHSLDCITLLDVIEHVLEPEFTLPQLLKYLKPDGTIIFSIPNVRWQGVIQNLLYEGFWRDGGQVIQKPHIRYFTLMDIFDLLTRFQLHLSSDISCVGTPLEAALLPLLDVLEAQGKDTNRARMEFGTIQYVLSGSPQQAKPDLNMTMVVNRLNWTLAEIEQLFSTYRDESVS